MNIQVLSLIGIFVALILVVIGSLRGISIIILASVAAFLVAATGGVGLLDGYSTYLSGVAGSVASMFPLFLGGQLLGCFLEKSGLTESIANSIIRRSGTRGIVLAVFTVSWLLVFCGINVFVIIFMVYPIACAFFKVGDTPRSLIPACVLGACVSEQMVPGTADTINVLSTGTFGVPASAGSITGFATAIFLFAANGAYLCHEARKARERGEHFVPLEGESFEVDIYKTGLPHPLLAVVPIGVVLTALNVFSVPAYASLYLGGLAAIVLFYHRLGGLKGVTATLNQAAKSSMSVLATCAIIGFSSIVAAVPGYELLLGGLERLSGGNPYIFAFICVAVIAGVSGSATGGVKFVLDSFGEKLLAMGGDPSSLVRVISASARTFDSLPHNSAIVLTLNACNVTHREGYKHLAVTTVLNTTIATIIAIVFAMIGIR